MFKPDDVVRVIDDKNKVKFIVTAIMENSDLLLRVYKNPQPEPSVWFGNPVSTKFVEIDIDYYRKQKIEKICSKMEM